MGKHFLLRISQKGRHTRVLRENPGSSGGTLQRWDLFGFQTIWVLQQSPLAGPEGKSLGWPVEGTWLASVFLISAPGPGCSGVARYILRSPLSGSHRPVTWRPPGKGRKGHSRGRCTQSSSNAVYASSARARSLPGAPAPWRRYLGCRSGGTWRRPQVPGSGTGCGSGPGRRIQEVAAPPARHRPATFSSAPRHSPALLCCIDPAQESAPCSLTGHPYCRHNLRPLQALAPLFPGNDPTPCVPPLCCAFPGCTLG